MSSAIPCMGCSPASATPVSRGPIRRAILSNFLRRSFEHWASQPQVFAHYAKHYQSGEPMPQALRDNMLRAATFNKGYDMSELLAAALLDMRWHSLSTSALPEEVDAFEQLVLREENTDLAAVPRAIAAAISPISSAAAMRQAITPICGPRCWPTTAINGSWSRAV